MRQSIPKGCPCCGSTRMRRPSSTVALTKQPAGQMPHRPLTFSTKQSEIILDSFQRED